MTVLPMFPLGSVLVPGMVLPLHVFEPRYRRLVADCLEGDRQFGVVLIERGSEVGGGDVRTDVGTVAAIVEAAGFPDGRWAVGSVGTRRVRVLRWLDDDPYPRAEVEDWPDPDPGPGLAEATAAMVADLRRVLALSAELGREVAPATVELAEDPVVAGYHAVAVAPLGPSDRQRLLAADDAEARCALLCRLLAEEAEVLAAELALGDGPDETP